MSPVQLLPSLADRPRSGHVGTALRATLLCVTMVLCAACGPPPDPVVRDVAAVQDLLDDLENEGFSGVTLVDTGEQVIVRGFGWADREAGIRNDADTVFDIGSVTKQFTAAAVLRLQMDGRLSVEDTLGGYLPGLPPDKAALTLHQLLTHTAGLPDALGEDAAPVDREQYLDLVAATPLIHRPGTDYSYSNVGYSLLAAVIETVTGGSYEDYLQEALFGPAGMTSTGYLLPDVPDDAIAVGYDGTERVGRPRDLGWATDGPYWNLRGNGGLLSTAPDMLRWHQALLGEDILDAEAKALFSQPHTPEGAGADTFYGYGWALLPTPFDTWLVTHNGGNGVFFADFLRFLDEDVVVFVATNAATDEDEDTAYRLADALFGLQDGQIG